MQHNVVDTVLSAFSRLRIGVRLQSPLGLSVCELIDDSAGVVARRPHSARTPHLVWREMDPPEPHRLRVQNRERTTAVVEAGAVLDGGMGTRVLRCCTVIPAEGEATVVVEPLSGRWWDEGPLRHGGRLDPVATALLFQAALAPEPLASSAITSLHSLPRADMVTGAVAAPHAVAGWLLEDDEGIVGGWILEHTAVAGAWPHRSWNDDLCAPEAAPLRLLGALQEDIEYGAVEAHMVEHGAAGRDLVLLPRGVCLADRARAAGSGEWG
jgi:hypothetical protein